MRCQRLLRASLGSDFWTPRILGSQTSAPRAGNLGGGALCRGTRDRGPARITNLLDWKDNKCHVEWQGQTVSVPLDQIRPHVFFFIFMNTTRGSRTKLMAREEEGYESRR